MSRRTKMCCDDHNRCFRGVNTQPPPCSIAPLYSSDPQVAADWLQWLMCHCVTQAKWTCIFLVAFTNSHTHSYISYQLLIRSNLGFSIFAQGHFYMQLVQPGIQTSDLLITKRHALPPESHLCCWDQLANTNVADTCWLTLTLLTLACLHYS